MNGLDMIGMIYGIGVVIMLTLIGWSYTASGKKWLKNL